MIFLKVFSITLQPWHLLRCRYIHKIFAKGRIFAEQLKRPNNLWLNVFREFDKNYLNRTPYKTIKTIHFIENQHIIDLFIFCKYKNFNSIHLFAFNYWTNQTPDSKWICSLKKLKQNFYILCFQIVLNCNALCSSVFFLKKFHTHFIYLLI